MKDILEEIKNRPDWDLDYKHVSWPLINFNNKGRNLSVHVDINVENLKTMQVHCSIVEANKPSKAHVIVSRFFDKFIIEKIEDINDKKQNIIDAAYKHLADQGFPREYRYSEIFRSIQGEGFYTGYPTIWYRTWGCNFNCSGFSAPEGVDPRTVKTEDLPQMKMDISNIKKMEDLPVFERGCDSSYSWSQKFAHLAHKDTVAEISKKLRSFLPEGKFIHPESKQDYHFAITGGEPMMSQSCIVDIMKELRLDEDMPLNVTIETNGTQMPREKFIELFTNNGLFPGELFWSCSPKLRASGEPWEKAIKPDVLWQYHLISKKGQLKYVADGTDECWDEVKRATELYREAGITWPVWIMPVGSLLEQQEEIAGRIADQAIERGYNVSARIHCYLWKNEIGR